MRRSSWLYILVVSLSILLIYLALKVRKTSESLEERKEYLISESHKAEVNLEYEKRRNIQESEVAMILSSMNIKQGDTLSKAEINSLSKFSESIQIKPLNGLDTSALSMLSPGRGKLLLSLIQLNLDSLSFQRAIAKINFSYSDLRGADLSNLNLTKIQLSHSNLDNAKLSYSLLHKVDLSHSKISNVNLENSRITYSRFNESVMKWSRLSFCESEHTIFDGAKMDHAKLDSSRFTECSFRMSSLKNAILRYSNFQGTNLWASDLERAQLNGLDLSYGLIKDAHLSSTDLRDIKFEKTAAVEDWFAILKASSSEGTDAISENYIIELDSNKRYPVVKYYLNSK